MGIADQRRRLLILAEKLTRPEPPQKADVQYLTDCLVRIGKGEDANEVFGLKRGAGQKEEDERRRRDLSMFMHLVRGMVDDGWDVEPACNKVAEICQEEKFPGPKYDGAYLRKCWYMYEHMRSDIRTPCDEDFPYLGLPYEQD